MIDKLELTTVFKEEAAELIDRFGVLVDGFHSGSEAERQEIFSEMFRVIHNLKGAARTVGHQSIEKLSHQIEEDLAAHKNDIASIPQSLQSQLAEATTALQMLLDNEPLLENEPTAPQIEGERESRTDKTPSSRNLTSIRVDIARFDELMGSSGDLLMSRARMEERHRRLKVLFDNLEHHIRNREDRFDGFAEPLQQMRELIQADNRDLIDFSHLTETITESMKRLRMVPLELAEREWREVVRKAGNAAGKTVDVTIHTGTIQLDKQVLDQLRDPMMHLLRNAVDHGLESPEERTAAGKPVKGRIDIDASLQGAMVQLSVHDDGRGVDREKVRKKAARTGLVEHTQLRRLSDDALLDLLFHPGFSTADIVTELSGRGVGLDVVRSRIEAVGGRVRIFSPPGAVGTAVVLSVPLSVLSTVGLHVKCGSTAYALPLEYVQHTAQLNHMNIDYMDGHMVMRQKDADPIRVVHLSTLVGETDQGETTPDKVVVLSRSNMLLGVLVDTIEGQYEFVTHSLPWNLEQIPGVSGGSLRPDGTVVVVLDVPYLFDQAGTSLTARGPRPSNGQDESDYRSVKPRRVLVVDDSLAARTMEKNILLEAGHEVTLAEDGEAAWKRLHEQSFDLLVSDVHMPYMDGLELTRRIRSSDRFQDLPVILVTSLDSAEAKAAGAAAGADEYIVKGTFEQQALLDVISRYL